MYSFWSVSIGTDMAKTRVVVDSRTSETKIETETWVPETKAETEAI